MLTHSSGTFDLVFFAVVSIFPPCEKFVLFCPWTEFYYCDVFMLVGPFTVRTIARNISAIGRGTKTMSISFVFSFISMLWSVMSYLHRCPIIWTCKVREDTNVKSQIQKGGAIIIFDSLIMDCLIRFISLDSQGHCVCISVSHWCVDDNRRNTQLRVFIFGMVRQIGR